MHKLSGDSLCIIISSFGGLHSAFISATYSAIRPQLHRSRQKIRLYIEVNVIKPYWPSIFFPYYNHWHPLMKIVLTEVNRISLVTPSKRQTFSTVGKNNWRLMLLQIVLRSCSINSCRFKQKINLHVKGSNSCVSIFFFFIKKIHAGLNSLP